MRRKYMITLWALIFANVMLLKAGPGDTIRIPVFDYTIRGDVKDKWVVFPDKGKSYEKILMYYSLKCDPLNTPYKCGEWDYLTYTYASKKSGKYQEFPNFTVDGKQVDTFRFMKTNSFKYTPRFETKTTYTDTLLISSTVLVDSSIKSSIYLNKQSNPALRFLWKKSELESAGLHKGEISGIWLRFNNNEFSANRFIIRLGNYNTDSLDAGTPLNVAFTLCYDHHIDLLDTGMHYFAFSNPFMWDSSSNILVDIQVSGNEGALDLAGNGTFWTCGTITREPDYFLHFEGLDNILLPKDPFKSIDKEITIALWVYGNPDIQPQNNCLFEGIDSLGKRILNCHLPWGNSRIYWDAGNDGSGNNRIEKEGTLDDNEGKWNFWAFTKNATKGEMKIYKNGVLWHSGTGMTKSMKGVTTFRIGSNALGTTNFYDGDMDDISIWNKCLEESDIKALMMQTPTINHPYFQNLQSYFDLNEGQGSNFVVSDGPNPYTVKLTGKPDWKGYPAGKLFKQFENLNIRPDIIFDQSKYTITNENILIIDSFPFNNHMLVLYNDFQKPDQPTDTLYVFPEYKRPTFNPDGTISTYSDITPDSTIIKVMHAATYDPKFAVLDRYEIGRYITPYGINLDLGEGFMWIYDVSDYAPLLFDSVRIQSGNWQELHQLEFVLIEGTPPRNPKRVINLWNGNPAYNANAENFLIPLTVKINEDETKVMLKMRTTGHGMGGNDNCAEFCPKTHTIEVNGEKRFDHFVWRDNCASNPLYPQGGTWIYQRANWCPGAEVYTHDFEVSPYSTPGDSLTLDYDLQPYTWNGQGSTPTYVIASQLITYGDFNFKNDAAIVQITRPTDWKYFLRENPSCHSPRVIIQNTGSDTLSSLTLRYGSPSKDYASYLWKGNLAPLQSTEVDLPFYWGDMAGEEYFRVTLSKPNGKTDEYTHNNTALSRFSPPVLYPNKVAFYLRTNNAAAETSYSLTDASGKVLYSRAKGSLANSKLYIDTFDLPNTFGCYKLQLLDEDGDGLSFWANEDGNGWARFKKLDGSYYPAINPDFGDEATVYFTTGWSLALDDIPGISNAELDVFPNPADDKVYCNLLLPAKTDVIVQVKDLSGKLLFEEQAENISEKLFDFPTSHLSQGMYFVQVILPDQVLSKKFLVAYH